MSDLANFVATYGQHKVIHAWNDALLCCTFPSLLFGMTQEWFEDLPVGMIGSFEELTRKFCQYFSGQCCIKENPKKLAHIRQASGKSFGSFLKHYWDQYIRCQRPTDPIAIQTFKQKILDKDFWMYVERFPPTDMVELWEVAV